MMSSKPEYNGCNLFIQFPNETTSSHAEPANAERILCFCWSVNAFGSFTLIETCKSPFFPGFKAERRLMNVLVGKV